MRFSQPTQGSDLLPYSSLKLNGCSDAVIGFEFLSEQPTTGVRRYCNKVLVHECLPTITSDPITLDRVEFLATEDPCYRLFDVFKSSVEVDAIDPAITIQTNEDGDAIGVLINFYRNDLCCLPLKMAYRMYGYPPIDPEVEDSLTTRVLLSQGLLYVTYCPCSEIDGTGPGGGGPYWEGINW